MTPDEPSDEVRDAAYRMAIDPEVMGRHLIAQAETHNEREGIIPAREAAAEAMQTPLMAALLYSKRFDDMTGHQLAAFGDRILALQADALLERGWLPPDSLAQVGWWHPEMGAWTTEAIRADTLGWVPVYRKVTDDH